MIANKEGTGALHLKEKYSDIIVNISHEKVDRAFQYKITESLE